MNLLNCIGVGTVARNKETNTETCWVYIPSYFPAGDGEISGDAQAMTATSMTKEGTKKSSKVLSTNAVPAKWMNINSSNRLSPPDVRVGSQVALYRWGDDQTLYWTSYGFGGEQHRLETVLYGWSASPDGSKDQKFNYDNFYVFEVSTHTGKVAFRTSQANGEKVKFEVALNPGAGNFSLADNEGNIFALDALNHAFLFQNQEKSKFFISRKQILLSCEDSMALNATESVSINTKKLNINTKTTTLNSPDGINAKGNTQLLGNLGVAGNLTAIAGEGGSGNIQSAGSIQAGEDVTAGGGAISLLKHRHGGIKRDNQLSDGPQ